MGKALYRQYRSTSFDEVIGQDHITTTLKNSLKSGSIAHAYLLTGPRGVGKTSIARILAHAVNDLPYKNDETQLDIIEIDAASNRRIDEVRSLRERVHIAPTSAKYKVYIIDEVHMLTREAFNALLKTLEEPPAHVIFILATTELHKLPDTIVSRCITFTFRPIEPEQIAAHLKHIAKQEKFKISDEALQLLALHGDGSFRDSISLLDQIKDITSGTIERSDVELALGLASDELISTIIEAVRQGDPAALETALSDAYGYGANEITLAKQLGEHIRTSLARREHIFNAETSLSLLKDLLEVPASIKPRARLELLLLSHLFQSDNIVPQPAKRPTAAQHDAEPEPVKAKITITPPAEQESDTPPPATTKPAEKTDPAGAITATLEVDKTLWDNVLEQLKKRNNTLYGVARMAKADLHDDTLSLRFKFPFHLKQVNQPKNKSVLTAILEELGHQHISIDIAMHNDEPDKNIANITNIFGEHEVLES